MLRKKIATLNVYLANPNSIVPSHMSPPTMGDDTYEIVLNPNKDTEEFKNMGLTNTNGLTLSTFAHELGHFVARVFKIKSHTNIRSMFNRDNKEESTQEVDAWFIAEQMGIPINHEFKQMALNTYFKHGTPEWANTLEGQK